MLSPPRAALPVLILFLATGPTQGAGLRVPGVLRVLASADEMPEVFSFEPRTPRPGYERELMEGFARASRLEMRIVPVRNWEQIIPMLLKGEGDVIVGIVDTAARRQRVAFTAETYPVRHMVVTRKPQAPVTQASDLRALKVAVIPGTPGRTRRPRRGCRRRTSWRWWTPRTPWRRWPRVGRRPR